MDLFIKEFFGKIRNNDEEENALNLLSNTSTSNEDTNSIESEDEEFVTINLDNSTFERVETPSPSPELSNEEYFFNQLRICFEEPNIEYAMDLFKNFSCKHAYKEKTWLHHAIEFSNSKESVKIIKLMLNKGFIATEKDENQMTPLHCVVQKLLKASPKTPANRRRKTRGKGSKLTQNDQNENANKKLYTDILTVFLNLEHDCIALNEKDAHDKTVLHYMLGGNDKTLILLQKILAREELKIDNLDRHKSLIFHSAVMICKNKEHLKALFIGKGEVFINALDSEERTPLFLAATSRVKSFVIETLLQVPGIDVNIAHAKSKRTPLHILACAKTGSNSLIKKMLLMPHVNVNAKDINKRTPLHEVCKNSNVDVLKLFLQHADVDLESKDHTLKTPLHSSRRNEEILEYLLDEGKVDVTMQDEEGKTLLHYYCQQKCRKEIVEKICKLGGEKLLFIQDKKHKRPSFYAHNANNIEIYNLVDTKESELLCAVALTDIDKVESLLMQDPQAGCSIDIETRFTALHTVVKSYKGQQTSQIRFVKMFNLILEKCNIDLNARDFDDKTALHYVASENIPHDVVHLLLSQDKIDVNAQCKLLRTPLNYSIKTNRKEIQKVLLLFKNIKLNLLDGKDRNVLHYYCKYSQTYDSFEFFVNNLKQNSKGSKCLFVEHDISLNALDNKFKTPLYYAAGNQNCGWKIIEYLLQNTKVSVNEICGRHKNTALHHAIYFRNEKAVECLLNHISNNKYKLDIKDRMERNVLHYCLAHGTKPILELIVKVLTTQFYRRKPWLLEKDKHMTTPLCRMPQEQNALIFSLGGLINKELTITYLDYGDIKALGNTLNYDDKWSSLCDKLNSTQELKECQIDNYKRTAFKDPVVEKVGKFIFQHIEVSKPKFNVWDLFDIAQRMDRMDLCEFLKTLDEGSKLIDLSVCDKFKLSIFFGKCNSSINPKDWLYEFGLDISYYNDLEQRPSSTTTTELLIKELQHRTPLLPLEVLFDCLREAKLILTANNLVKQISKRLWKDEAHLHMIKLQ